MKVRKLILIVSFLCDAKYLWLLTHRVILWYPLTGIFQADEVVWAPFGNQLWLAVIVKVEQQQTTLVFVNHCRKTVHSTSTLKLVKFNNINRLALKVTLVLL
jgi:hypothetical protein